MILSLAFVTILNCSHSQFLAAIRAVESGGNSKVVGDGGKSIGAYQISLKFWQDALEFDASIGGVYHDCFQEPYGRKVVIAYMKRYAKDAWEDKNWARLASIHHLGGPRGRKTLDKDYWSKVKAKLYGKD